MTAIDPRDARDKYCCTVNRQCASTVCMAWRYEVEETEASKAIPDSPQAFPGPPNKPRKRDYQRTGKGYCGMVPCP
jgi:hypothetical protein